MTPNPMSANAVLPSSRSLRVSRPMPWPARACSSRVTLTPSMAGSTGTNAMAFTAWPGFPKVARTGGLFDRTAEVQERLLQAPGEEARLALAPLHHLPPPEGSDPDPKAAAPPLTGPAAG